MLSLSAISLVITNRSSKKGGRNLDELNECSLAGGSGKQEKIMISSPVPPSLWIVSVCQGKYR